MCSPSGEGRYQTDGQREVEVEEGKTVDAITPLVNEGYNFLGWTLEFGSNNYIDLRNAFDKYITHINIGDIQNKIHITNVGFKNNLKILEQFK